MGRGHYVRGWWLFWYYPLTRYHLTLEKFRRIFNKVRWLTMFIIGLNFFIWAGFIFYKQGFVVAFLKDPLFFVSSSASLPRESLVLFWFGVISFSYVYYRSIREKEFKGMVERYQYEGSKKETEISGVAPTTFQEVKKISIKKRHNIADTFTDEALQVLGAAYHYADQKGCTEVTAVELCYALLSLNRIGNIFIRLGILAKDIQALLGKMSIPASSTGTKGNEPSISEEVWQVLFSAYEKAYQAHQDYVSVTEVMLATIEHSESLQDLLYDSAVDKQKLINVAEWARIRERLFRAYKKLRKAAGHRGTTGIDKAMTAVATPYLNQFSDDVTMLAQFGHTEACVAREKELEEIFRVVEGGEHNVLLVGDYGVGKKSIVDGIAERMVEDDVPERLRDKRLVRLNISALLAGTTPAGAVERLIRIMNEVGRAGNIILFINNIHEMMGVSAGEGGQSLDVADTLTEFLGKKNFLTIAITTTEAYQQAIANSSMGNVFTQVEIKEMDENQAIQAVESKIGFLEYKQQVFFSYDAIARAVQLAKRFLHESYLPGNALEVVSEAASLA
jgi:ATP-dependent Clp protease ATP-binding subunit ClpC